MGLGDSFQVVRVGDFMDDLVFYREAFLQAVSTLDEGATNFSTPNVDDLTLTISTPTLSDTRFREAWVKERW